MKEVVQELLRQIDVIPKYNAMLAESEREIARLRLTDEERADLEMWLAECLRQASTATEGANDELAERWKERAKRAAAMIERLGGVE